MNDVLLICCVGDRVGGGVGPARPHGAQAAARRAGRTQRHQAHRLLRALRQVH